MTVKKFFKGVSYMFSQFSPRTKIAILTLVAILLVLAAYYVYDLNRYTPIPNILVDPANYMGKTVAVRGEVVLIARSILLSPGDTHLFTVREGNSPEEIMVVSTRYPVPKVRDKIKVKGVVGKYHVDRKGWNVNDTFLKVEASRPLTSGDIGGNVDDRLSILDSGQYK